MPYPVFGPLDGNNRNPWADSEKESSANLIFDKDELMVLNKPGVKTDARDRSNQVLYNKNIKDYLYTFVRSKGYTPAVNITSYANYSPYDVGFMFVIFDNELINDKKAVKYGRIECYADKVYLYVNYPLENNTELRKKFMLDLASEVPKATVVFLATRDAKEKKPADPTIIGLTGGKHDDLAKLYQSTYSTALENKPGLLSKVFGSKGGKTRRGRKIRSRKAKKTRKH